MKNCFHSIVKTATLSALACACLFVVSVPAAQGHALPSHYPRLANYFLKSPITVAEARQLAKWDVLILGMELQYTSPSIFPVLRGINPDIILLAYVPSEEIPVAHQNLQDPNHPHYKLLHGVADEWWLHDPAGNRLGYWPGTQMLNVSNSAPVVNGEHWNTYLPQFIHNTVMKTGLWNGIFYDNVWPDISWLNNGNIDLDGDGDAEAGATLDAGWKDGMATLLAYSRRLEGNHAFIIGNGGGRYYSSMNGRLFEAFPSASYGGWAGEMRTYVNVLSQGFSPAFVVLNGVSTTNLKTDYRTMRFGLASTLLDNGFFSFDAGIYSHAEIWWYDEYGVALGLPVGKRRNLLKPASSILEPGVWRRDFENGIVLLNSTNEPQTIPLADAYEEITPTQASNVNHGTIVTSVTISPLDAKLLLRRQFTVRLGQYENGSFARSFTNAGVPTRQAFLTYDKSYPGGAQVIKEDLNGDGGIETVIATDNAVQIRDAANGLIARFLPYGSRYRHGVTIAVGDLDGNGKKEIVTGTGDGGGPQVRLFSNTGKLLSPGFFAYNKHFRGGVNVAVGDVNGDGKDEIVTGAGIRGGPHVRIFTAAGKAIGGFFAYEKRFRGGVHVAVGDVTGDETKDIVTSPGPGRNPYIRILSARGAPALPGFLAFDTSLRSGVSVNVLDINDDYINDILVGAPAIY